MNTAIYRIPGLGFTPEIFSNFHLEGYEVIDLEWIEPESNESIQHYAARMAESISHPSPTLLGHSFGGMVAQEIAAQKPHNSVILISSIKSRGENPGKFKIIAPLGIHYLFNRQGAVTTAPMWAKHFGYETKEEQELFIRMISQQSNPYLRWALKQVSNWKAPDIPSGRILQIHGNKDRTFPYKLIKQASVMIEGGTHMMVFNRAAEISEKIRKFLSTANF